MVLDECPPWPVDRDACALGLRAEPALGRALQGDRRRRADSWPSGHHVFAIAQGSTYDDLRREAAEALAALDFSGYAVGGVSVGEPEPEMLKQVAATTPYPPGGQAALHDGPRDAAADPEDDRARRGHVRLRAADPRRAQRARVHARRADQPAEREVPRGPGARSSRAWTTTPAAISPGPTCATWSSPGEMLGGTLLTIHNLHFFLDSWRQARAHIEAGDYGTWHRAWIARYEAGAVTNRGLARRLLKRSPTGPDFRAQILPSYAHSGHRRRGLPRLPSLRTAPEGRPRGRLPRQLLHGQQAEHRLVRVQPELRAGPARRHRPVQVRGGPDLQPGLPGVAPALPVQPDQDDQDVGHGRDQLPRPGQAPEGAGLPGVDLARSTATPRSTPSPRATGAT